MKDLISYKIGLSLFILVVCCFASIQEGAAQINPLKAIYFYNQYLANPALAGVSGGLKANLHYRNQWGGIPDGPTTQALTAEYGFSNKVGIGLNVGQTKEGLLSRTRAMGTYSYHLPLNNENRRVHFGLSVGVVNENIDMNELSGEIDDNSVARFNSRGAYVESELGVAYTDTKLTLQAAFPNIRSYFDNKINDDNTVNRSTFFAAASYRLSLSSSANLEPKVVYRGVKGFEDFIDVGANLSFVNDQFNLFSMYHSSKNATFGFGLDVKKRFFLTGMYTTSSAALNDITGVRGSFELGLRASLWNIQ